MITVLVVVLVVAVCLAILNSYVPMDRPIRIAVNGIVVLILLLWALEALRVVHFPR